MEHRATETSKGRITIPKAVRWALGIRVGDSLLFKVRDGDFRLRVERAPDSGEDAGYHARNPPSPNDE